MTPLLYSNGAERYCACSSFLSFQWRALVKPWSKFPELLYGRQKQKREFFFLSMIKLSCSSVRVRTYPSDFFPFCSFLFLWSSFGDCFQRSFFFFVRANIQVLRLQRLKQDTVFVILQGKPSLIGLKERNRLNRELIGSLKFRYSYFYVPLFSEAPKWLLLHHIRYVRWELKGAHHEAIKPHRTSRCIISEEFSTVC